MTEQEAIELLRFAYPQETNKPITEEVISIAVNALEKQIPKKLQTKGYFKDCECGCEISTFLFRSSANYCPNCGQKIDWNIDFE